MPSSLKSSIVSGLSPVAGFTFSAALAIYTCKNMCCYADDFSQVYKDFIVAKQLAFTTRIKTQQQLAKPEKHLVCFANN
jgi:hypothetical protein